MAKADDDDIGQPAARKPGRPPVIEYSEATLKTFAGLGRLQCTNEEVAAWFACAEQTVLNFWAKYPDAREAFDQGKQQGRVSLRRSQFRLADKNATMAIFLGMNVLDQEDRRGMRVEADPIKHEHTHTVAPDEPKPVTEAELERLSVAELTAMLAPKGSASKPH